MVCRCDLFTEVTRSVRRGSDGMQIVNCDTTAMEGFIFCKVYERQKKIIFNVVCPFQHYSSTCSQLFFFSINLMEKHILINNSSFIIQFFVLFLLILTFLLSIDSFFLKLLRLIYFAKKNDLTWKINPSEI